VSNPPIFCFFYILNIMDAAGNVEVDIEAYPTAKKLVATCQKFFGEVGNL
jgi:hypothetical protein